MGVRYDETFKGGLLIERTVVDTDARTVTAYERRGDTLAQTAQRAMTAEEIAEHTAQANAATIEERVRLALKVNRAFLALTSPTAAQTVAQVKALTRQVSALIRMQVQNFSEVE